MEFRIRNAVAKAVRSADLNSVSAKQIRTSVESQLGLEEKELSSERWKSIVKEVIQETMAAIERGEPGKAEESEEEAPKKVRRKKAVIQDTPPSSPAKAKLKSPAKLAPRPSPQKSDTSKSVETKSLPKKKRKSIAEDEESDSDMSVLIDSTPPDSKPSKKSVQAAPKQRKKESDKSKPKDASTSTKEDEVKKLKSLVYQCGVRKNWSKELPATMSTSEQISHLKKILNSLGMTGRLSAEKAKKIKTERELKDELEFIQEGARKLGEGHRRKND